MSLNALNSSAFAAGIEEEHRRLLPDLALEAHVRLIHELRSRSVSFRGELFPLGHGKHNAEMADRDVIASTALVLWCPASRARDARTI